MKRGYIEIHVPLAKRKAGKGWRTIVLEQRFYCSVLQVKVKKPDHDCQAQDCSCWRKKR